jgi:hypothetical protein
LTGLLNACGLQKRLTRLGSELRLRQESAVFFYIQAQVPAQSFQAQGVEAQEMGMVQLAASLSSHAPIAHSLARCSGDAFALVAVMPHDSEQATLFAQKIISRSMALALNGTVLAAHVQVVMLWLPPSVIHLAQIQHRCQQWLLSPPRKRRISWLDGPQTTVPDDQLNARQTQARVLEIDMQLARQAQASAPSLSKVLRDEDRQVSALSPAELAVRIDEIERRVLGEADTTELINDADVENARHILRKAAEH